ALRVIAEIDQARIGAGQCIRGRVLLEAQAAVFDDVVRAVAGDAMSGRRASPPDFHGGSLDILSDNITRSASETPANRHECPARAEIRADPPYVRASAAASRFPGPAGRRG